MFNKLRFQIVKTMSILHENQIQHLALLKDNIFVDLKTYETKITNFSHGGMVKVSFLNGL